MADSVNLVRARANAGARIESGDVLLQFDAIISVGLQDTGTLTQVPIEVSGEAGESVADHYQNSPVALTLRGIVTDTPNPENDAQPLPNRALDFLIALRSLKQLGQPLNVITNGRGTFSNMVITSVTESQTQGQGHAVGPTVRLEQVRFTSAQVTYIPPLAEATSGRRSSDVTDDNGADDAAAGTDERGRTTATEADAEESAGVAPAVSLFGGLFGVN